MRSWVISHKLTYNLEFATSARLHFLKLSYSRCLNWNLEIAPLCGPEDSQVFAVQEKMELNLNSDNISRWLVKGKKLFLIDSSFTRVCLFIFLSDEAVNPPAESTFTMSSFHLRLTGGNATTATPLPLSLTWLFFCHKRHGAEYCVSGSRLMSSS